ncbi:hypothetical protein [Proteus hauseri]
MNWVSAKEVIALENLTVEAATGTKNTQQLAQYLRKLSDKN